METNSSAFDSLQSRVYSYQNWWSNGHPSMIETQEINLSKNECGPLMYYIFEFSPEWGSIFSTVVPSLLRIGISLSDFF